MADRRSAFLGRLDAQRESVIELCRRLAATDSQNPPGDTNAIAEVCASALSGIPGIEVRRIVGQAPMTNLVAQLSGGKPGRRLILNGHLDTGPVADPSQWSVPPFGARSSEMEGNGGL